MIRGIGTSKGIGIGKALLIDIDNPEIKVVKVEDTQAEKERFKAAVEEFCNTTQAVTDELESKLKGSNKPLIDTDQLRKAITHVVSRKGVSGND